MKGKNTKMRETMDEIWEKDANCIILVIYETGMNCATHIFTKMEGMPLYKALGMLDEFKTSSREIEGIISKSITEDLSEKVQ